MKGSKIKKLVLVFCDAVSACWKKIVYFKPAEKPEPVKAEAVVAESGFDVPKGYKIISDERGVRIVPDA